MQDSATLTGLRRIKRSRDGNILSLAHAGRIIAHASSRDGNILSLAHAGKIIAHARRHFWNFPEICNVKKKKRT
jgi:hypothetical protein